MIVSIATGTSNNSCSDALTLPISDWLFHSEGGASCDWSDIWRCIFPHSKTIRVTCLVLVFYSLWFSLWLGRHFVICSKVLAYISDNALGWLASFSKPRPPHNSALRIKDGRRIIMSNHVLCSTAPFWSISVRLSIAPCVPLDFHTKLQCNHNGFREG